MNWFKGKKTYTEMKKALVEFMAKYHGGGTEQTEEEKNTLNEIYKEFNESEIVKTERANDLKKFEEKNEDLSNSVDSDAEEDLSQSVDSKVHIRQDDKTLKGYLTSESGANFKQFANYTDEAVKQYLDETFKEINLFGINDDKFANLTLIDYVSNAALSNQHNAENIQEFKESHQNIAQDPTKLTMEYLNHIVGAVSKTPKFYAGQVLYGISELEKRGATVNVADPSAKLKTYKPMTFPKDKYFGDEIGKNREITLFNTAAENQYSKMSDYVDKTSIFTKMLANKEDKFDAETLQDVLFGKMKGENKLSPEELNAKVNKMIKGITETKLSSRADGKVHNRDKVNDLVSLYSAYKSSAGLYQQDPEISKKILKQINKYRIHDIALKSRGLVDDYIKQERAIDEISTDLRMDAPDRANKYIREQERAIREKNQALRAKEAKVEREAREKEDAEKRKYQKEDQKEDQKEIKEESKKEDQKVQTTPNGAPNGTPGEFEDDWLDDYNQDPYYGNERRKQESEKRTSINIPSDVINGEQEQSQGQEIIKRQSVKNPPDIID